MRPLRLAAVRFADGASPSGALGGVIRREKCNAGLAMSFEFLSVAIAGPVCLSVRLGATSGTEFTRDRTDVFDC